MFCVVSELAGPQQDVQRAGRGRERDTSAQTQVLLLRPERGLPRPGAAQPALRAGQTTNQGIDSTIHSSVMAE